MRAVEVTISVSVDGSAVILAQKLLKPGHHKVLIIAEEGAVAETDRHAGKNRMLSGLTPISLPQWPANSTFRREEIYNDDGR